MIPEYVQKIKDWPMQKMWKAVATFLGFVRYYRTFISQYSVLTNQLNWIKKVKKLKKAFTKGGIQAFPDFGVGDPFILTMDWSRENIAGMLSQVQGGQERFLVCWGRKCNKYEQNYPSYKG